MEGQKATPTRRDTGALQPDSSGRSLGWKDGIIPGLGSSSNMPRPSPITPDPLRWAPPLATSQSMPNFDYDSGASEHDEFTPHLRRNRAKAPAMRALPAPPLNTFASTPASSAAPLAISGGSASIPNLETMYASIEEIRHLVDAQNRTIQSQNEELRNMRESGTVYGNRIANLETNQQRHFAQLDAAVRALQMASPALPQITQRTPAQLPPARAPLAITQGIPAPNWPQHAYDARNPTPAPVRTTPNPQDDVFFQQAPALQFQQQGHRPPGLAEYQHHQQLVRAQLQHQRVAQAPAQARNYLPTTPRNQTDAPRRPAEPGTPKPIADIHITICGKIENFVTRFCVLELPEHSRDRRVFDLFQECRTHVETVWRARHLIRDTSLRKFLYVGMLHRALFEQILNTNILHGFRCDQTDKYCQVRHDEFHASGLLTGANDYKLRDDLAKRRSTLANIIVCETKGFHGWMARNATERAQRLIDQMDSLIPPMLYNDAASELTHIVHELYRFAARLACEPYFYTTTFYQQNTTFDHKVMIHRNPELNGQRIEDDPSKHVTICMVVPELVQKDFSDHNKMQKKFLHKAEVLIVDRKDANMRS